MSPKLRIRIQQIARMRVAGTKDEVIAQSVGLTRAGLSRIVALPEYQELEEAILNGHLSQMDEALAGKIKDMKREFEVAVPAALRTLVDAVTQRRDLRTALAAAGELLDRDPNKTFAKTKPREVDEVSAGSLPDSVMETLAAESKRAADDLKVVSTVVN